MPIRRMVRLGFSDTTSVVVPATEVTPPTEDNPEWQSEQVMVPQTTTTALTVSLLSQQPNAILEESAARALLQDRAYCLQEKYDGKHVMVRTIGDEAQAFNKKGQPILIPQEILDSVLATGIDVEVDGELIGNRYVVYDLLKYGDHDLRSESYFNRYSFLASLRPGSPLIFGNRVEVAPLYRDKAKAEKFQEIRRLNGEGVVFKNLGARFTAGKAHVDFFKFKFYATCSCVVMQGREGKRSVGLGLLNSNVQTTQGVALTFVGNCTIPPNKAVPGVGTVVEVRYLYYFEGGSLYQPTYIGPRDDVDADECLMSQLKYKTEA